MKKILLPLFVLSCYISYSQEDLCLTRGHVKFGKVDSAKFAWCKPYLVDKDTVSYIVYPSCYTYRYVCLRCGSLISVVGDDKKKVTVWQK